MPRKLHTLSDKERAKRIRATARAIGTDNNPKALDNAFKKIVVRKILEKSTKTEDETV
jgi:hypothetical protein